ncbi:MAG: hypothetical protein ACRC6J_01785 [Cetobacterium sp.]
MRIKGKNNRDKFIHLIREDKSYFEDKIVSSDLRKDYFVKGVTKNNRILNQSGSFIIFGINSEGKKERKSLGDDEEIEQVGFKYGKENYFIIPSEKKNEILKALKIFDIHKGSVYPNFEKVAEYLKEEYKD